MRKLFILLVFVGLVAAVYYGFMNFKDKTEKDMEDSNPVNKTTDSKTPNNPAGTAISTIDHSYYSVCLEYVKSVDYQITLNQITSSEVPSTITDPNFTSTRIIPNAVELTVGDRGVVDSGTVTYEHIICHYNNGKVELEKKN